MKELHLMLIIFYEKIEERNQNEVSAYFIRKGLKETMKMSYK